MNGKETRLQQNLAQLRTRLLVMCATALIAVDEACAALASGNRGKAVAVMDNDAALDALETEIDESALSILARCQPVAQDLRFVAAGLRMVADIERIGDEAATIAEQAILLGEPLPGPFMAALCPLAESVRASLRKAVDAFRELDGAAALVQCGGGDEHTQREVMALQKIVDTLHGGAGADVRTGMHAILICRALNRVSAHAANIAEHTYFITRGENIKHGLPKEKLTN